MRCAALPATSKQSRCVPESIPERGWNGMDSMA